MTAEKTSDFFSQHGIAVQTRNLPESIPFQDHVQFQHLLDILSRKSCHHSILYTTFSEIFYESFAQALALYLGKTKVIYIDMANISPRVCAELDEEAFAKSRIVILANAKNTFVITQILPFLANAKTCIVLLAKPKQFNDTDLQANFQSIDLAPPTEKDMLDLLNIKRLELEKHHEITIPSNLSMEAYQLASRFLSADKTMDKSLLLLDSAAARAAITEEKSLTLTTLVNVIACWTQIPSSHVRDLHLSELTQHMQQLIFGQNLALTTLHHGLQHSHTKLRQSVGPLCSFLFAGPEHTGKKSTARALVDFLFQQPNVIYFTEPLAKDLTSLLDIKLHRSHEQQHVTLKSIIRDVPYAVIYFKNIDQASSSLIDDLQQVLSTGHLYNSNDAYNFKQAIIILDTTIGTDYLTSMTKSANLINQDMPVDLMQIITNKKKQLPSVHEPRYSSQEVIDGLMPIVNSSLSNSITKFVHVIPFFPLNKSAIEKIMHLKLTQLNQELENKYAIELSYAQEIVKHLTNEAMNTNINKTLHHLYFCIEQTILNHDGNQRKLVLQLNETGQLLRCDWVVATKTYRERT